MCGRENVLINMTMQFYSVAIVEVGHDLFHALLEIFNDLFQNKNHLFMRHSIHKSKAFYGQQLMHLLAAGECGEISERCWVWVG